MQPASPAILFEDNHLLVAVKPPGMPSQGDPTGDLSILDALKANIKRRFNKPGEVYLGLVHRLDRPVGGVMVFARTSKAAARLSEQFRTHSPDKRYWAVVSRKPEPLEGELLHHLRVRPGVNQVQALRKPTTGTREARLHYTVLRSEGVLHLVEVQLLTGRRHQIRAQLAAIGSPLVGDVKYGAAAPLPDRSVALWARSLSVEHPVTRKRMFFEAPLPDTEPWAAFGM